MSVLKSPARNLVFGVSFVLSLSVLAILGYMYAGWNLKDAIYMVVITIFSVGYGEVRPIDTVFLHSLTIGLIFLGCTGMIFLTGALVQFFTFNQLQTMLGIKRMESEIQHLHDHIIVCGYGRIGVMLAKELRAGGSKFLIIDRDEVRIQEAKEAGYLHVHGEASDEAVLKHAGIDRARVLATVLPDDAANVFITLSARNMNKSIQIIARGELPSTESKLLHAGASNVVLPTHIGAERIAEMILYPETAKLFRGTDKMRDFEKDLHQFGLELEVVSVEKGSEFASHSVAQIEQKANGKFFIVAVNRADGSTVSDPEPALIINAGDGLVIIGRSGRRQVLWEFKERVR
jgi:voltage-gated potassium channel